MATRRQKRSALWALLTGRKTMGTRKVKGRRKKRPTTHATIARRRTVWLASGTDEEFTSRRAAVADVVKRGGRAVI